MQFKALQLQDVKLIKLTEHLDARGSFAETFRLDLFSQHCGQQNGQNQPLTLVQDNLSRSATGVLRGLHFQHRRPQGKLIQLLAGRIYDVLVDLRPDSSTFGQWEGIWLDAAEPSLLWVPPGFAHGFYVSAGPALVSYKCTEYYQPDDQYVLAYNDTQLAIDWPCQDEPLLSPKDEAGESWQSLVRRLGLGLG